MTTAKAKAEPQKTEAVTADAETGVPDPDTKVTASKDDQQEVEHVSIPNIEVGGTKETQQAPQLPSLSRSVHYVIDPELPNLAAIVTSEGATEPDAAVSLVIFKEHLQFFRKNVAFDPSGKKANTWHWPERV
ncbi:hypothetical protein SEA_DANIELLEIGNACE_9 [Arthrobacter phage DanielleIgnace]|nr:hypothetical protein SEA_DANIELLEIGNACE_9 [Arthrobacter phage DanielleIgnace]